MSEARATSAPPAPAATENAAAPQPSAAPTVPHLDAQPAVQQASSNGNAAAAAPAATAPSASAAAAAPAASVAPKARPAPLSLPKDAAAAPPARQLSVKKVALKPSPTGSTGQAPAVGGPPSFPGAPLPAAAMDRPELRATASTESADGMGKRSRSGASDLGASRSPPQPSPSTPGSPSLGGFVVDVQRVPTPGSLVSTPSTGAASPTLATRLEPRFTAALTTRPAGEPALAAADVQGAAKDVAHAVAALGGQGAVEKAKTLLEYLKDPLNEGLRQRVRSGEVSGAALVAMGDAELMNPEAARQAEAIKEKRARERNVQELLRAQAISTTDMFPCPSCGKRNCTMMQKQTRSGDEPMTVYCTCLECGRAFRRM